MQSTHLHNNIGYFRLLLDICRPMTCVHVCYTCPTWNTSISMLRRQALTEHACAYVMVPLPLFIFSCITTMHCGSDMWCLVVADESGVGEEEQASGTTATVMLVRKDKIVVANIGDSRAVLSRHGQAVDLSTEHRSAPPACLHTGASVQAGQPGIILGYSLNCCQNV